MTYTVKNVAPGPRGIHALTGTVFLDPGESRDLGLSAAELKSARSTGHFQIKGGEKDKPSGGYEAREKSAGWWAVYDGDAEVGKSIRADEAEKFNAMTDAEKADYVAQFEGSGQ